MYGQPQEELILGHPGGRAPGGQDRGVAARAADFLLKVERNLKRFAAQAGVGTDVGGKGDLGEAGNFGEGDIVTVGGPGHGVVVLQPLLDRHGYLLQPAVRDLHPG